MDFRSKTLRFPARFTARLIAILALAALVAVALAQVAAHADDTVPQVLWDMLRYFTILTTILTFLTFAVMGATGRSAHRLWLGGITLWEVMSGGIYHALLSYDLTGLGFWASQGLHTAMPVLVLLWWLVFAPKAQLRPAAALTWLLWPILYISYVLLRGAEDGIYPYFFLDPGRVRWDGVAVWSGMIGLGFLVGGLVLVFVGRMFKR